MQNVSVLANVNFESRGVGLPRRLAELLRDAPTEFLPRGEGFSECRCKVHKWPEVWKDAASVGCVKDRPGWHPVVRAAYDGTVEYCHAEPCVREADWAYQSLASDDASLLAAYMHDRVIPAVGRLSSRNEVDLLCFGAGYCHLDGIRSKYRWRAARVGAMIPLIVDVLRMMKVSGIKSAQYRLKLVKVAEKFYHVEKEQLPLNDPRCKCVGEKFVEALMAAVHADGYDARIGVKAEEVEAVNNSTPIASKTELMFGSFGGFADSYGVRVEATEGGFMKEYVRNTRVRGLVNWIGEAGIKVPKAAWADLAMVTHSGAVVPKSFVLGPERIKAYAYAGDAVLQLLAAFYGLSRGLNSAMMDGERQRMQNNEYLAGVFETSGLVAHVRMGPTNSPSVKATMVEALIGVLATYRSLTEVAKLLNKMKLGPDLAFLRACADHKRRLEGQPDLAEVALSWADEVYEVARAKKVAAEAAKEVVVIPPAQRVKTGFMAGFLSSMGFGLED